MKLKLLFTFFVLFSLGISANENLSLILSELNKKHDLSNQTKNENVGYVDVFTRNKLDRLHITTLKELLQYINYIPYIENDQGLTNGSQVNVQGINIAVNYNLNVYIDNQALILPFQGSEMEYFSQINLNFIDHIEIYWGMPSFKYGSGEGLNVIKLYTKTPSREQASVVNISGASDKSFNTNFYSAYKDGDFSYLISFNKTHKNRKDISVANYPLKRDQDSLYFFSKASYKNSTFSISASEVKADSFIGDIQSIKDIDNDVNFKYFHLGWEYLSDDESFLASLGYNYSVTKDKLKNKSPLLTSSKIFGYPLDNLQKSIEERYLDFNISKSWENDNNSFTLGARNRYVRYELRDKDNYAQLHDGTKLYNNDQNKNKRNFELSPYIEYSYLFNDKNLISSSLRYDYFKRDGKAKNNHAISGRLGFVHNQKDWTFKTFYTHAEAQNDLYLFVNYMDFMFDPKDNRTIDSLTSQLQYRFNDKSKIKVLTGRVWVDISLMDFINTYALAIGLEQTPKDTKINVDLLSLNYIYDFDSLNSIELNYYLRNINYNKLVDGGGYTLDHGGYITLLNNYKNIDFANSLLFTKDQNSKAFYNLNSKISYNYNNKLKIYLKGENILNSALKQKYIGVDLATKTPHIFDVSLFDRRVWLGMEYIF